MWWGESSHLPKTWSMPGSSSLVWHFENRLAVLAAASSFIARAHAGEVTSAMGQWVRGPGIAAVTPASSASPVLGWAPVTPSPPPQGLWWHQMLLCNPSATHITFSFLRIGLTRKCLTPGPKKEQGGPRVPVSL